MNSLSLNNKSKKKIIPSSSKSKPKPKSLIHNHKQKGGCESCINLSSSQIKDLNATFGSK